MYFNIQLCQRLSAQDGHIVVTVLKMHINLCNKYFIAKSCLTTETLVAIHLIFGQVEYVIAATYR